MISIENEIKVLVTGADGFVGRNLVSALEHNGIRVLKGVRKIRKLGEPHQVELGDLRHTSPELAEQLHGVRTVVHLAGFAHQPQRSAERKQLCFEVNVQGTRVITEIASRAGMRQVIFLSSVKAHGEFPKGVPVSEDDSDSPDDSYGLSKLQAENVGLDLASRLGIQFIALRPPLIYGRDVRANFLNFMRLAQSELPLPLKNVGNLRSLCYVENLCDAIIKMIQSKNIPSGKFYVADSTPISTRGLLEGLAKNMDCKTHLFSLPTSLVNGLQSWPITGKFSEKLFGDLFVDTRKIQRQLNWIAPFSTEEGLKRTAIWYLDSSHAKRRNLIPIGSERK